jgi:2-polyprenyl-3-methyl-5-hydroxy-6-metoxy-1,4-benzoquinol methylase
MEGFGLEWHPGKGRWIDVGFGNGSLLFTAEEYGFEGVGLDLRPDTVAFMNHLGVEAHCTDIVDYRLDHPVSVVSMADVLEHMPYPKAALEAAHRLMCDGSILFVSMPNMGSLLWREMTDQNVNPYWVELEHYHNFSRERLYALLEETGFLPLRFGVSLRYRACMEVTARAV